MLFALIGDKKTEAIPNTIGKCPLCGGKVFSKCGEVNNWHWAHHDSENCDSWYEPETEWHKSWKLVFGKENCEKVIRKDDGLHIADIYTQNNVVIELQNSPIQKSVIRQREVFYGARMIWIINGKTFKNNIEIKRSQIDFDEEYYNRNNPFASNFGKVNTHQEKYQFQWSWPKRSWKEAKRPVFLDLGDKNLFMITEGIGTPNGKGEYYSKEMFIKKYGGNIDLLSTVINI